MSLQQIVAKLWHRYPGLEPLSNTVFRGVDKYEGRPYAIRYFDLTDDLVKTAKRLEEYQDTLLGSSYFDARARSDLRWNHYLYFVTSRVHDGDAFRRAKTAVESDRHYARKVVVDESELDAILDCGNFAADSISGLPLDALSTWTQFLEEHRLGFIVDASQQIPAVVRTIADGVQPPVLTAPGRPQLDAAETGVASKFLQNIAIKGFRRYPVERNFSFGTVNLILGVNGVGKTSLLEAVEYLYCDQTRRYGALLPDTAVSGTLANTNLVLQTKATTAPNRLRSRHLAWYGKSEIKTLTLSDSFSKFNFLDTDAAVRLTVEQSTDRIVDDLAQLLLGAESAKVLDRFKRVYKHLRESIKSVEAEIVTKDARRLAAMERIGEIRSTPRLSDQLYSDLLSGLRGVGWIKPPANKHDVADLQTAIQSALIAVGLLKTDGSILSNSVERYESIDRELKGVQDYLKRIEYEGVQRRREQGEMNKRLAALATRLQAIEELGPIVGSGVAQLHRNREATEHRLLGQAAALAIVESAISSFVPDATLGKSLLSNAIAERTLKAALANEQLEASRKALKALEDSQNLLSSLRQRLRDTAHDIIRHSGDTVHCPLCWAGYSQNELKQRLDKANQDYVTKESERLRLNLRVAEVARRSLVGDVEALKALGVYADSRVNIVSVAEAIARVSREREEHEALRISLERDRVKIAALTREGMSFQRLVDLSSVLDVPEPELTVETISIMRSGLVEEQRGLHDSLQRLEQADMLALASLSEIEALHAPGAKSVNQALQMVSNLRITNQERKAATITLRGQLVLKRDTSALELEARLRAAHELVMLLRTSVAREAQESEVIAKEQKLVNDASSEINGARVRLERFNHAEAVLTELFEQRSEKSLADEVVRENAVQIASKFSKIHAPNEFKVVGNDVLTITRGGSKVTLEEMSSGQRAAFALSLFLAMNGRLSTGPKVLLLDDPVAHVDDINILSLLDHLREIALGGQRQIFFATADAKIGALFGRKFRFLGGDFKQIELSRDEG